MFCSLNISWRIVVTKTLFDCILQIHTEIYLLYVRYLCVSECALSLCTYLLYVAVILRKKYNWYPWQVRCSYLWLWLRCSWEIGLNRWRQTYSWCNAISIQFTSVSKIVSLISNILLTNDLWFFHGYMIERMTSFRFVWLDNWITIADMMASITRTPTVWICSGINGLKGNAV